jgi:hypothetical protein
VTFLYKVNPNHSTVCRLHSLMEADRDGRGGGAEVLISHLSGEILHSILLRLPSTAAVARTSLISSRWRRVWTHIPELVLGSYGPAPTQPPPYGSSRSPE